MRLKLLGVAAAAATAVTLTGCSSSLDYGKLHGLIKSVLAQKHLTAKKITCPPNKSANKGTTFQCQATLNDGRVLPFTVRIVNDNGYGRVLSAPTIFGPEVEAVIKSHLAAAQLTASVVCPSVEPARLGVTFQCSAKSSDGQVVPFKVTSKNSSGTLVTEVPTLVIAALADRQFDAELTAHHVNGTTTCPQNVPIAVGRTFTCSIVTSSGQHAVVTAQITGPAGQLQFGRPHVV